MIILLLKLALITSTLVLGYTIASQEDMLLWRVRFWAENQEHRGAKWASPLFLCHWCQPSSFAFLAFGFAYGLGIINHFEWKYILLYILTVCLSSLVCGLVWGVNQLLGSMKESNDALTISMSYTHEEENITN